jgi:hypothetical protein
LSRATTIEKIFEEIKGRKYSRRHFTKKIVKGVFLYIFNNIKPT